MSTRRQVSDFVTQIRLPFPPTQDEKYSYAKRSFGLSALSSVLGFVGVCAAIVKLALGSPLLWVVAPPLVFTLAHRLIWVPTVLFSRDFDLRRHHRLVKEWSPERYPDIDIFLPICGEDIEVLKNTWGYVAELKYPGQITTHCLDDSGSDTIATLAALYGFVYLSRPNLGWHKKAGNLRYGYERSSGDFIVVFDADFCPRTDFLTELLPYFDAEPGLGIVQSPQYFRVHSGQNWLERGAGADLEPFYRILQTSRQHHDGAICVGTNAIYRRAALDANGGNALVDYSEDVHTGIELRRIGWGLRYVPIVLATGLCPDDLPAFFAQQYRWSRGCLGLRCSRKFWSIPMPLQSRLSYLSGPIYYLHRVVVSQIVPVLLAGAILMYPEGVNLSLYALLAPWMAVMLPAWFRGSYRADILAARMMGSWASLFATIDLVRGRAMAWQPTGGKVKGSRRFLRARRGVIFWNGGSGLAMMAVASWTSVTRNSLDVLPVFVIGLGWLVTVLRIARTSINQAGAAGVPIWVFPRSAESDRLVS